MVDMPLMAATAWAQAHAAESKDPVAFGAKVAQVYLAAEAIKYHGCKDTFSELEAAILRDAGFGEPMPPTSSDRVALEKDDLELTNRLLALDCARLLLTGSGVGAQIAEARVLQPAIQRWSGEAKSSVCIGKVLSLACAEARSAHEAIALAEQGFSFLLTDEVAPPVSGGL